MTPFPLAAGHAILGRDKGVIVLVYKGHVQNGGVILDEPVALPEGTPVTVTPAAATLGNQPASVREEDPSKRFPLRGMPYSYADPFESALPEGEWAADL